MGPQLAGEGCGARCPVAPALGDRLFAARSLPLSGRGSQGGACPSGEYFPLSGKERWVPDPTRRGGSHSAVCPGAFCCRTDGQRAERGVQDSAEPVTRGYAQQRPPAWILSISPRYPPCTSACTASGAEATASGPLAVPAVMELWMRAMGNASPPGLCPALSVALQHLLGTRLPGRCCHHHSAQFPGACFQAWRGFF